MHPWYKSDKPGVAPDCGMKLEPIYVDGPSPAALRPARKISRYRDPKDPSYTSQKPGLNPATGNELEPVYADEPAAMPANAIQISPDKQQLVGVRYKSLSGPQHSPIESKDKSIELLIHSA